VSNRVLLSADAKRDLEKLWWYSFQFEDSVERANRALDDVEQTIRMLADSPALGTGRRWLDEGQRAFRSRRYMVVYREISDGIEVARVTNSEKQLRDGQ
jgi:toxin ParE1/3/4